MNKVKTFLNRMIGEEGDYSLLQDAVTHGRLLNCIICQKHAANISKFDFCQNCEKLSNFCCQTCLSQSPTTKSIEILQQIKITNTTVKQTDAPKLLDIGLRGKPSGEILEIKGEYVRQDQLINRFPYWKHIEQNFAIWYSNVDEYWCLGHIRDLGTSKSLFANPTRDNKWPDDISSLWKHHIQQLNESTLEFSLTIICE